MERIWLRVNSQGQQKEPLSQRVFLARKNEQKQLVVVMGKMVPKGKRQDVNLAVILAGKGAQVQVLAIMQARGKEKLSLKILIHHQAPQTKANVLVKAVVDDQAVVDFNGKIKIEKSAQLSNAFLKVQTLTLSDMAKANCLPQLEIRANDVKAGHAATIGKIDEEQLFYLMSRGLNRRQSTELIVNAFLNVKIQISN